MAVRIGNVYEKGGSVMKVVKWNLKKLLKGKYERIEHIVREKFSKIYVEADRTELKFALANDGKCRVECYEGCKTKSSVMVEDDTLVIKILNKKVWYNYIGIYIGLPQITIYLPETEYYALNIKEDYGNVEMSKDFKFESVDISLNIGNVSFEASTSALMKIKVGAGEIDIKNISAVEMEVSTIKGEINVCDVICEGDIHIDVTTGKGDLQNVKCKILTLSRTTGSIKMNNVLATERVLIKDNTGDGGSDDSDENVISIETATGIVKGITPTDEVFLTDNDGANVPESVNSENGEICMGTGNVKMDIISKRK